MQIGNAVRYYEKSAMSGDKRATPVLLWGMLDVYQDLTENLTRLGPGEQDRRRKLLDAFRVRLTQLAGKILLEYYNVSPEACQRRTGKSTYSEIDEIRELELILAGRYHELEYKRAHSGLPAAELTEFYELHIAYTIRIERLCRTGMAADDLQELGFLSDLLGQDLPLTRRIHFTEDSTGSDFVVVTPIKKSPRKKNSVNPDQGTLFA